MLNYFSMGDCAKIGYEFERNRTASRCGNIIQYAFAGMKRICCSCCWTQQENRPLRDQIKYAKQGSNIDTLMKKETALQQRQRANTTFNKQKANSTREARVSILFRQTVSRRDTIQNQAAAAPAKPPVSAMPVTKQLMLSSDTQTPSSVEEGFDYASPSMKSHISFKTGGE